MDGYRCWMEWTPAWDKRDPNPERNFGIHSMELRALAKGPAGVVQFVLYTGWLLPHIQRELTAAGSAIASKPLPADVGYHSPVPQYEDQEPMTDSCEYLDGKRCFYDGSSLSADRVFGLFVAHGEPGLWWALAWWYRDTFFGDVGETALPHVRECR